MTETSNHPPSPAEGGRIDASTLSGAVLLSPARVMPPMTEKNLQSAVEKLALTLDIPAPCDWLNMNQRLHWAQRAKLTKWWRSRALIAAKQARLPRGLVRVHITATVHKATNRKYDVHNLLPTAKAVVDGLVDYGLITDDSNEYLTGPDMRAGVRGEPRLAVVITPIPERFPVE